MTDPQRLLDSELGSLARQVLDSAQADDPDAQRITRLRLRLGLSSAVGAASVVGLGASAKAAGSSTVVASGASTGSAASGAAAGLLGKAGVLVIAKWTGAALIPLAVGATLLESRSEPERPAQSRVAPSGRVHSQVAPGGQPALPSALVSAPASPTSELAIDDSPPRVHEVERGASSPEPSPGRSDAAAGPSRGPEQRLGEPAQAEVAPPANTTAPTSQPTRAIEAEVAQLDAARRALAQGNAALSLIELDRHAAAFPRGALLAEATVLRIAALQQSGKPAEATRLAQQFLARHPSDPLARRVRALLGESRGR